MTAPAMPLPRVVESSFVTPSEKTATKRLWLSAFDVVNASRGHTPTVYLYRNLSDDGTAAADFFDVSRLKVALAKALVPFYPLAGRLGVDQDGRPEIDCNDVGAVFVVARSDELAVDDLRDLTPSTEIRRVLVPQVEPATAVMAIQVTFLKCGGVVLGAALHHSAVDGLSAFHFFQTWSSLCRDRDGAVVEPPCHDRTLLRARSPPAVHPDAFSVFCPKVVFSEQSSQGQIVTKVFGISRDQIAALKRVAGGASTFRAVSAHVWRCLCVARQLPPDATTRLTVPANARRCLCPPLPDRYFGNACVWVGTSGTVGEITSEPLAAVADRIKGAIAGIDDEVARSAVDYFEMELAGRGEESGRPLKGSLPETEVRMNSWLGLPIYDADFGWGTPELVSRAQALAGGVVNLTNGRPGDDGSAFVRVLICMEAARLEEFELLLYGKSPTVLQFPTQKLPE